MTTGDFEERLTTEARLRNDLASIGVVPGMTLLVHSSLSSTGWVVGGAPSVVRALLHVLGDTGTLVMPASTPHCADSATWAGPRVPEVWLAEVREHLPIFDPRMTAAACFAVIAGLSARRLGEIMDLGAGCTFVDMDGRHWIRIYIEKTLRTYEQMPVPAAVHQAVECLEEISAEAREETGDDSLWQYRSRSKRRCVRLRPNLELNTLSRFIGGDLHERWSFHAHQFRRFFALVYFWRYESGDVAALAHHLRHFDLEMTRQYVTDGGFGRIWQDVAEERQRDVLASVVDGSRWVGGPAGDQLKARIEALRRRYRRDVQVVAAERIVEKLLRLAKKWGSACKLHVWGTLCVCPQKGSPDQGRHAHCKGAQERGPVFSQTACARCPYAVHTERFEPAARAALADQENLDAGLSEGTLLKSFVSSNCEDLRRALQRGEGVPTKVG